MGDGDGAVFMNTIEILCLCKVMKLGRFAWPSAGAYGDLALPLPWVDLQGFVQMPRSRTAAYQQGKIPGLRGDKHASPDRL